MNFMKFMAQELREYMAKLGVRTVDELVGRTDLLKVKACPAGSRASEMDLSAILQQPLRGPRTAAYTLIRRQCLRFQAGEDHGREGAAEEAASRPSKAGAEDRASSWM